MFSSDTHLNLKVGVKQELKLEAFFALVSDCNDGLQAVFAQRDTVDKPKICWPCFACLLGQTLPIKSEVKLDRVGLQSILGGRLAQELPARGAGEAVLWEG